LKLTCSFAISSSPQTPLPSIRNSLSFLECASRWLGGMRHSRCSVSLLALPKKSGTYRLFCASLLLRRQNHEGWPQNGVVKAASLQQGNGFDCLQVPSPVVNGGGVANAVCANRPRFFFESSPVIVLGSRLCITPFSASADPPTLCEGYGWLERKHRLADHFSVAEQATWTVSLSFEERLKIIIKTDRP
jgi:hypothetical protein